jgi:hypothetical protein
MKVRVYPYKSSDGEWSAYLGTEEYVLALGFDCHKTSFYIEVDTRELDKQGRIRRKIVVNKLLSKLNNG